MPDPLGDFLLAYEEYLDGKRAYSDVPALISTYRYRSSKTADLDNRETKR
jgi:hypothetical protein